MIKGSAWRHADHPIDPLFLDRWSPRAMSGEEIPKGELLRLFEAARWAPSSYNNQPWRILYARRDTEHWSTFFHLLNEGNRRWCGQAAVLLLFISKTTLDHDGTAAPTHSFDCGAAWQNLALQSWLCGYVVHGMQGFDYAQARVALKIPDNFRVEAMAAIGRPGDPAQLLHDLQPRETPSGRKPLRELVGEGLFHF